MESPWRICCKYGGKVFTFVWVFIYIYIYIYVHTYMCMCIYIYSVVCKSIFGSSHGSLWCSSGALFFCFPTRIFYCTGTSRTISLFWFTGLLFICVNFEVALVIRSVQLRVHHICPLSERDLSQPGPLLRQNSVDSYRKRVSKQESCLLL